MEIRGDRKEPDLKMIHFLLRLLCPLEKDLLLLILEFQLLKFMLNTSPVI
jgi:hypothetical protein